ncbi:hypothetical protein V8E53_006478 [Lactarius tabidus]
MPVTFLRYCQHNLLFTPVSAISSVILMLRTYAFSGRKKAVLAILSIAFFGLVGVIIWVTSQQLSLSYMSFIVGRAGCFAISDQPTLDEATIAKIANGIAVQAHFAYHIGHCIKERGTFGPLGQSFLKQGIPVYIIMTALNTLTIGTFFR